MTKMAHRCQKSQSLFADRFIGWLLQVQCTVFLDSIMQFSSSRLMSAHTHTRERLRFHIYLTTFIIKDEQ